MGNLTLSRFIAALWLVATTATIAMAADVTGQWVADVPGRGGQTQSTTFAFKVDGEKLTGSVTSSFGETPISDGKVQGDDISFTQNLEFGGNKVTIIYKGKASANEIRFTRQREGGQAPPAEFTAKRKTS